MWTSGLKTVFTLGGESLVFHGQNTEEETSSIGVKGQNIPVAFEYHSVKDAHNKKDASILYFTGLTTIDWKFERIASSTGVVYAENIYPIRAKDTKAEQGVSDMKDAPDEEGDMVLWMPNEKEGHRMIENLYYPQPCLEDSGGVEVTDAHFFGTYTMRYNAAVSKKAGVTRDSMEEAVDNRVPLKQRNVLP